MVALFCKNLPPMHRFVICGSWLIQFRITHPKIANCTLIFNHSLVGFARKFATTTTTTIASEKVTDNNIDNNAEIVKTLLRNYGFTDTHISKLVNLRPKILSANPQKTLLPKLDFLRSIGLSNSDLPRILFRSHALLGRSLENQIIPCYNSLKTVLFLDENDIIEMLKRRPRILLYSVEKNIAPNMYALRAVGTPQSVISYSLRNFSALQQDCHKFKESVNKAVEMGFNPLRLTFVHAVQVLCEMTKSTWEHKMEVYQRCGMSKDEILSAFRSHPVCMNLSEGKITRGMDFLVKEMGWRPFDIARCPVILFFNLEKRIIPRCAVVKVLLTFGLVKKNLSLSTFLLPSEQNFLDKYVNKYQVGLPDLMSIYLGKNVSNGQK